MDGLLETLRKYRKAIYLGILILCVINGLALSLLTFRQNLDMGDSSTFYEFARNLSHGEAIYKDFIHFRTPGTVMLQALFVKFFGVTPATVNFAIRIETQLLYPLVFLVSAIILFRKKKNPLYVLAAFLGIAFLPGVAQLRAGFGLLALVCYIASFEEKTHEKRWLWLAGIFTGITFLFGQEIALMLGVSIIAGELFVREGADSIKRRVKVLVESALVGSLPLLLYIAIFSTVGTFLYYVFYYSFVVQPKYMNLPFPGFAYSTMMYYLPFVMYVLCFLVLYGSRALGKKEGLLLGFGILRLITAVGRSDFGHLIFSIPEIFIIVPYFLFSSRDADFSKRTVRAWLPYGIGLIVLMMLGMWANSIFLVFAPFLILYALRSKHAQKSKAASISQQGVLNVFFALGASLVLFVFLLWPSYTTVVAAARYGWSSRHAPALYIGGVRTNPVLYQEITGVQAEVAPLHPTTIFSFPIDAFFYSLAPHHASRFITFEFETTVHEQDEAIADLERTKPQVIIFNPLQAQGLSSAVWKISDYVTSNYQLDKEISNTDIFWVMVSKHTAARDDKLVYQLYKDNTEKTAHTDVEGVQDSAKGLNNAIMQNDTTMHFSVDAPHPSHLTLSLLSSSGTVVSNVCGKVVINTQSTNVCATDGMISIPIHAATKPATITFQNTTGTPIIWNDVSVTD